MDNSLEIIEQYLKSKKLQAKFESNVSPKLNNVSSGVEVEFLAISQNQWPFPPHPSLETDIEPVVYI